MRSPQINQNTQESNMSSTGSGEKHLGMTAPISLTPPDQADRDRTAALVKALEPHGCFEGEQELTHRMEVLATLNQLVKQWIKDLSIEKNMPPTLANTVGGHVYTFGSYRLGVHNKGADIDALCVVPRHIHREDYFDSFYALLQQQPEVAELRAVPDAFVPVIKMIYDGIDIDMTFARLALKEVTDNQLLSDPLLLKNLDPKCVRSLNGCRVTDEILNQVPNKDTFRITLRTIKLWAKKHGIYSNVLGYLGGVSWAMLVARVCQLYPNADSSTLVQKFFMVFYKWQWPQPVLLKKPTDIPGLGFPVWDPRQNVSDRFHLMPIITPAYPQQNSTFNVSKSTLEVMKEEFRLSLSICEEIIAGKATWEKLFESPNFFLKYKHYIVLEASSATEADQIQWYGHVESKVRHLVGDLERDALELAHVWPKTYPSLEEGKEKTTCYWFIGLVIKGEKRIKKEENSMLMSVSPMIQRDRIADETTPPKLLVKSPNGYNSLEKTPQNTATEEAPANSQVNLDLTTPIRAFCELVMRSAITNQMWKDGMCVEAFHKRRRALADYLPLEERQKLKPERKSVNSLTPNIGTGMNTSSSNDLSMSPDKTSSISNSAPSQGSTTAIVPISGKRRPSDTHGVVESVPDVTNERSNGTSTFENSGSSRVSPIAEGDSISDAQPPPKRINTEASASSTTNSGMINGLEVS